MYIKNKVGTRFDKFSFTIPYAKGFKPPSRKNILDALGKFSTESSSIPWQNREYFEETKNGRIQHFNPIPECNSEDDWLAQYNERGQTFSQYHIFSNH